MPLRSEFFRSDVRLEGAASRDSAHVIPGARGPHVEKIQLALMLLDDARIATAELAADAYGPTTAAAVLAYKRRRRIVNERYQIMPDSIVGRLTMAALDREMMGRQVVRKRCGCTYMPVGQSAGHSGGHSGGRPPPKPFFFAFAIPAGGRGGGTGTGVGGGTAKQLAGAPQSTLDMALAAVPDANGMRLAARMALDDVIAGAATPRRTLGLAALERHYKVTAAADIDRVANAVRNSLAQVSSRLLSARAWLRQGTVGGFADTPTPRDGHTYINLDYGTAGTLLRPTILIHEAFHDIVDTNQDFGGNPASDGGVRYHRNDTATQLQNAYAMSQFVLHIHVGHERILGDTE